ncbi:antigen-presenting glycoprotein CD1d isoform X2 [Manis pentadactyla]|uniref:antigen-presenting glycoprotein CD1d isoform X2 n=1 Tax=Manis pentadactyla TaxID=143292 RepID=UPI00255C49BC|nr:antigen-presenting glycoprotein CD1d isoform X2 [Manis pentadactyla]
MGAGGGGRVSEPRVPEAAGGRGEPGPGARARRAARSLRPPAPTRRFCFLSFLLLRALSALPPACGAAEERPFRCLQASSFPNRSSSRTDGAAWLGELQTHAWRNDSDAIRFLRPWSRGEFGDQEWEQLQDIFRVYRSSFTRDVHELDKMLRLDYPFEIQVSAGCAILAGNSSESAFHVAFQGREILSFQGMWVPVPDAPKWVGAASKVLNQDRGTSATIQWLLNDTCPRFVRGLLAAGKADLETQVKPEAWLSGASSPGPGRLLLACHVSGFRPKPVWAMWMRGEQEQLGTQRGDVLPNADGTWHLRVTLDVAAGEAAGLSCRVRHSSLGGQDVILYWGEGSRASVGLIAAAVLAVLFLVIAGSVIWFRRRRSYQDIL